jgi:dUTP pyrophosphatase
VSNPSTPVILDIQRLPHAPRELPAYETSGSAGMDLRLAGEAVSLAPGDKAMLPTGFCVAIPQGYEGQVRLRSGFAFRSGLVLPNAPGTIDSDYRGEIKILVLNVSRETVRIESGERVAQLIIAPVVRCAWNEVTELPASERGAGGFGSTGRK